MLFILLVEYSSIDWHDFVVVETINFRQNEMGQLLCSVVFGCVIIHMMVYNILET